MPIMLLGQRFVVWNAGTVLLTFLVTVSLRTAARLNHPAPRQMRRSFEYFAISVPIGLRH